MKPLCSCVATVRFLVLVSILFHAQGAAAQNFTESLISADNAYNPIPSPDGKYIAYVRTGSTGKPPLIQIKPDC